MDESILRRMKEVDAAVKKLDLAVRSEAFAMLRGYIMEGGEGQVAVEEEAASAGGKKVAAPADFDSFVDKFDSDVPADNAMALAAWLYAQYGIEPFAVKEIKDLADQAGMTIPTRPDMTFSQRLAKNKKAFRKTTKGFRPTVDGEAFLKETYGVRKGTKKRPKSES